jgi:hypothetical protein
MEKEPILYSNRSMKKNRRRLLTVENKKDEKKNHFHQNSNLSIRFFFDAFKQA